MRWSRWERSDSLARLAPVDLTGFRCGFDVAPWGERRNRTVFRPHGSERLIYFTGTFLGHQRRLRVCCRHGRRTPRALARRYARRAKD